MRYRYFSNALGFRMVHASFISAVDPIIFQSLCCTVRAPDKSSKNESYSRGTLNVIAHGFAVNATSLLLVIGQCDSEVRDYWEAQSSGTIGEAEMLLTVIALQAARLQYPDRLTLIQPTENWIEPEEGNGQEWLKLMEFVTVVT